MAYFFMAGDVNDVLRFQKTCYRVLVPPPATLVKQTSAPARLPSIDSPPRQRVVHSPPINLRQSHYSIIPPLSRSSTTSPEDVDSEANVIEDLPCFPDIGEPHPFPYFITAEIDLRPIREVSAYINRTPTIDDIVDDVYPYDILENIMDEILEEEMMEELAFEAWNEERNNQFKSTIDWPGHHEPIHDDDPYVDDVYPYEILEGLLEEIVEYEQSEEIALEVISEESRNMTITLYNKFATNDGRMRIRCPIHGPRYS